MHDYMSVGLCVCVCVCVFVLVACVCVCVLKLLLYFTGGHLGQMLSVEIDR